MQLNLTKPLAFIDLETTGINVQNDRIIEIAIIKINVDQTEVSKRYLINPQIPIPALSTSFHGITDEMVKDAPSFKDIAHELNQFLKNCDFAGYNSNKFDIPLLVEEFYRVDIDLEIESRRLVDVMNIFYIMEPRNLAAAYKFYCNKQIENAHSALADIQATLDVFKAQLELYKDREVSNDKGEKSIPVKNDMEALHHLTSRNQNADLAGRLIFNAKGEVVFNFGKHKDKPVKEIFAKEPGYYSWMMNGEFPLHTKRVITRLRLEMK